MPIYSGAYWRREYNRMLLTHNDGRLKRLTKETTQLGSLGWDRGRGRSDVLDDAPSGGWVEIKLTETLNSSTNLGAGTDVFVSKLDPSGILLFTDTFAGKGADTGTAITLDPSGNIYIGGTTTSPDFPLSEAQQTQSNSNGTGFIIK